MRPVIFYEKGKGIVVKDPFDVSDPTDWSDLVQAYVDYRTYRTSESDPIPKFFNRILKVDLVSLPGFFETIRNRSLYGEMAEFLNEFTKSSENAKRKVAELFDTKVEESLDDRKKYHALVALYQEMTRRGGPSDAAILLRDIIAKKSEEIVPTRYTVPPSLEPKPEEPVKFTDLVLKHANFFRNWIYQLYNYRESTDRVINKPKLDEALFEYIKNWLSRHSRARKTRSVLNDEEKQKISSLVNEIISLLRQLDETKSLSFPVSDTSKSGLLYSADVLSRALQRIRTVKDKLSSGTMTLEQVIPILKDVIKEIDSLQLSKYGIDLPPLPIRDIVLADISTLTNKQKQPFLIDLEDSESILVEVMSELDNLISWYESERFVSKIKQAVQQIEQIISTYFDVDSDQFNIAVIPNKIGAIKEIINRIKMILSGVEADIPIFPIIENLDRKIGSLEEVVNQIISRKPPQQVIEGVFPYDELLQAFPQHDPDKTRDMILDIVTDPRDRQYIEDIYFVISTIMRGKDPTESAKKIGYGAHMMLRDFLTFLIDRGYITPEISEVDPSSSSIIDVVRAIRHTFHEATFPKESDMIKQSKEIDEIAQSIAYDIMSGTVYTPDQLKDQLKETILKAVGLTDKPFVTLKGPGPALNVPLDYVDYYAEKIAYIIIQLAWDYFRTLSRKAWE